MYEKKRWQLTFYAQSTLIKISGEPQKSPTEAPEKNAAIELLPFSGHYFPCLLLKAKIFSSFFTISNFSFKI